MATKNTLRCSFCGQSQSQVESIVKGPGAFAICTECVDICLEIAAGGPPDNSNVIFTPQCSICKREEQEIGWLIPGAGVCICDECLDICVEVRDELVAKNARI